ncbi:ankyrin repeat protein, partial [Sphaerosporella brunnea]
LGSTPLHCVASRGQVAVARLLISHGVDVSAAEADGVTPLHRAAFQQNSQIPQLLGADVSPTDNYGLTPLYDADRMGHEVVARALIENGAAVSANFWDGSTLLLHALLRSHERVARVLIDHRPNAHRAWRQGVGDG